MSLAAIISLFDCADGSLATAASLSPADAARHAFDLSRDDALLLTDEALVAVAKVRPVRFRKTPPPPLMPRIGRRHAVLRSRALTVIH